MNRKYFISAVSMLLLPLITLLQCFYISDRNFRKWIIILFITVYGSIINLTPGTDGFSHQARVDNYYTSITFERFLLDCVDVITFTTNDNIKEDLYMHFLAFFCAGILGLPKTFFVFVSFVYGYFFVGSLFKVINLLPNKKYSYLFYGFLAVFIFWKNIEGINPVRTWTGLWVLFYSVISYYETKKLKYLLLMFTPPYIHVGFFIMAMPVWLVVFLGSWPRIFSILFFISFSFNIVNPASMTEKLEETEVGQQKVKAYYVEDELAATAESKLNTSLEKGRNWYVAYSKAGYHNLLINILASVLIIRGYYPKRMTLMETSMFSMGLLTKVLSSATWFIFALSNRSAVLASIFILGSFILMAQRGAFNNGVEGKLPRFENISFRLILIGLIPFFILRLSEWGEFLSIFIISAPFIIWFDPELNISIKDAFKAIIGF